MVHICEYGCGQEAKYQFKNGNWCCSENVAQCPTIRKKNSEVFSGENSPNYGKHFSKEYRKKIGDGLRTPFEEIIEFVENQGYILLSKEKDYKNQFSYLWFRCPKGHIFKKRWDNFKAGHRCSECAGKKQSQRMKNGGAAYVRSFIKNPSKPQVELFDLVKEEYPESILEFPCLNYSVDIVIPNLKIAIEYDGSYWHQDQESDDKRQKEIEDEGWTFLRYRDYVPSKIEIERDIFFKVQNSLILQEEGSSGKQSSPRHV